MSGGPSVLSWQWQPSTSPQDVALAKPSIKQLPHLLIESVLFFIIARPFSNLLPRDRVEMAPHFTFSKVTWRRSPERTEGPGHISVPVVLLCVCNNYSALSMNGINEDPVFGREVV